MLSFTPLEPLFKPDLNTAETPLQTRRPGSEGTADEYWDQSTTNTELWEDMGIQAFVGPAVNPTKVDESEMLNRQAGMVCFTDK